MRLTSIDYVEYANTDDEWRLPPITLGQKNLIVGENATGKSRTLNIIGNLGRLVCGEKSPVNSGRFEARFDDDGKVVVYTLDCVAGEVTEERLKIGRKVCLSRPRDGVAKILAEEIGDKISFKVPSNVVAAVARLDSIQHPFLERLYNWGKSVQHYYFGAKLGQSNYAVFSRGKELPTVDPKDTEAVAAKYYHGYSAFEDEFDDKIISDMKHVGFTLTEVGLKPSDAIKLRVPGVSDLGAPWGVFVREQGIQSPIEQHEMSQGMFRALSLVIQLNYAQMSSQSACLLIDDIGEGLDYTRSTSLIELVTRKASASKSQLIMASNDRFVMNTVPLETWTVLARTDGGVRIYNRANSKERFQQFEFTGLSNFDFFSSEYFEG